MVQAQKTAEGIVALFNASDDTIDMVQNLLTASGDDQTLIWCHFADLKKGIVDFDKYLDKTQSRGCDFRPLTAVR
jgi:hypothetical protein